MQKKHNIYFSLFHDDSYTYKIISRKKLNMSLLQDWFNMPGGVLRGLSELGITAHWIILQYTIGLLTVTMILEIAAYKLNDKHIMKMARSISKVAVTLFVFGAITGSLSEFGLLLFWPNFLELVGKYYFIPLFLEVFAFLTEVVFVYMYYYTWERVGRKFHVMVGVLAVLGIFGSALLIMSVNTLMSYPPGLQVVYDASTGIWQEPSYLFYQPDGGSHTYTSTELRALSVEDFQGILAATISRMGVWGVVFQSPGALVSTLHAITASINVSLYTIIGVYSYRYLKYQNYEDYGEYYFKGIKFLSITAVITMTLQGIIGHAIGQNLAIYNPEKLAAFEGTSDSIISFGNIGFIDKLMAWLAYGNTDMHVLDYDSIPAEFQPPLFLHYVYYLKIILSVILFTITIVTVYYALKKKVVPSIIIKVSVAFPFVIQIIANFGWITREAGRKPWTIYGIMTVDEAARDTPVTTLYFVLVILYCLILLGGAGFLIKKLNTMKIDLSEQPEEKKSVDKEEV